jgi:hypothetical protein
MRSPLASALTNPTSLTILVLSVLAGLLAAWWLFPIGLLIWGGTVWNISRDKALRINYNMQAATQTLTPRFQGPYSNVVRAQMRIFNMISSTSGGTRRLLEPVQAEIESLVNHAYFVCQQMTSPDNYVKIAQNTDYEGQRALLVLSTGGIADPAAKKEKEDAIHSLETRLQEIKDIEAMVDHAETQISGLAVSLDSLLAEIMSLQVRGSTAMEKEIPDLVQKIHQQTEQLQALEDEAGKHQ